MQGRQDRVGGKKRNNVGKAKYIKVFKEQKGRPLILQSYTVRTEKGTVQNWTKEHRNSDYI